MTTETYAAQRRAEIEHNTREADADIHARVLQAIHEAFGGAEHLPVGMAIYEDAAVATLCGAVFRVFGDFDSLQDETKVRFFRKEPEEDGVRLFVSFVF